MAIWEAKRQCPQIILVVGDNRKYTYTSTRIFNMMLDYTPLVEVFSIDEAFLDITHSLKIFGLNGQHLHDMGLGIDHSPVVPASDQDKIKSVGHSMTLKRDVFRHQDILKYLLQLSEMIGRQARRYSVSGKTIHLYVRYADFYSSFGKQQTLDRT